MTLYSSRLAPIRAVLGLSAALLVAVAAVPSATAATPVAKQAESRSALTARIERYLNSITTLRARFLQISPAGDISRGTVLLSRPGKLRIDYDPPVPVLIVTEGSWLMLYDKDLESASYTSLDDSLAGFLVRPKIRLAGDMKVRDVREAKNVVRITIVRRESPEDGTLTLVFSERPLTLRQWTVVDGRGGTTSVALEDPEFNGKIDAKAFDFTPPEHEHEISGD